MSVSRQLRKAITNYGTVYAVSRDSGVAYSVLCRFAHGKRDLYLATADKLVEFFGLELTPKKDQKG